MIRHALATISTRLATMPCPVGWQRLHARSPDCSAWAAVSKNRMFSRLGRRAGHDGLQNTPVVTTP
jgi:hypothetical protein